MRPRQPGPDDFEQNPLSQVSERLSLKAAEGLDDAGRVREALRIVIDEGAQGIKLTDQHGHSIVMDSKGITIDAGSGNVTIKGSKVDVQ